VSTVIAGEQKYPAILPLPPIHQWSALIPYLVKSRGERYEEQDYTGITGTPIYQRASVPAKVQEVTGYTDQFGIGQYILDGVFDPYSSFVNADRSQFEAEMKKRGFGELPPDRGHPFLNRKFEYLTPSITATFGPNSDPKRIRNASLTWRPSTGSNYLHDWRNGLGTQSTQDLDAFAKKALVETAPTLSEFSLAGFLGELREGLPKALPAIMLRDKGRFFKSVGSDYLNVQFGWIPFLKDLQAIAMALSRASYKLNAIQGVPIRRHFGSTRVQDQRQFDNARLDLMVGPRFNAASTVRKIEGNNPLTEALVLNVGTGTVLQTTESKMTFVGSYVTLLPKQFDDSSYISRLNQLMDLSITPAVLWQLSPWSWFVDWFLDIQTSIESNLLAGDENLLIHYAYASQKVVYRQLIWGVPSITNWKGPSGLHAVTEATYYRRIRANPYGFSVGPFGGLSNSQLAILGALGLSKKR
jgi:hypothetical protein